MRNIVRAAIMAAGLASLGAPVAASGQASAPGATAAALVTAVPARLAAALKKGGFTVEQKVADGEVYLRANRGKESYAFSIFFYGCDDKTTNNCKSVQFYSAFTPTKKPTVEAMNAHARDNRWGRIYLDKDLDPVIEMDLDLEKGGMSEALFIDNVEYYEAAMNQLADAVFKD